MRLVFCLYLACQKQMRVSSAIETELDTWIGEEKERGQQKRSLRHHQFRVLFLIITWLINVIWQTWTILLDESFQGPILCIQNKRFNVMRRVCFGFSASKINSTNSKLKNWVFNDVCFGFWELFLFSKSNYL